MILEAQFGFAPDTTMPAAAKATVAAAQTLYGCAAAAAVTAAFQARGSCSRPGRGPRFIGPTAIVRTAAR